MTLVEKLKSFDGSVGEYKWVVEVWRSDMLAKANLRLRLVIYRINKTGGGKTHKKEVYRDHRECSRGTVERRVKKHIELAQEIAERFEDERIAVEKLK